MDCGLWVWFWYFNYFGEVCVWWGLGLMVLFVGGWFVVWSLVLLVMMMVLLFKVLGVVLLE